MKKKIHDFRVIENRTLSTDFFIVELQAPEPLPEILPGQFAEVLVEGSASTFLRRPISIHDVDYVNNTVSMLIQIKGQGTKKLSKLKTGDFLNVIYPLGNTFQFSRNEVPLLVGGGCGIAPLLYLARKMNEQGVRPKILIGGRSKDQILEIDQYRKYGDVYVTTQDGSMGEKGLVTQHSLFTQPLRTFDKIYTCGPDAMMKALARYGTEHNVACDVSLENMMACGIGACLCCVVETHKGNECVCTQGPVFNALDIKSWNPIRKTA